MPSEAYQTLDPLSDELAWEDVTELATAYFDANPVASSPEAYDTFRPDSSLSTRTSLEQVQQVTDTNSNHFGYDGGSTIWDPAPCAPILSRNAISESLAETGYCQTTQFPPASPAVPTGTSAQPDERLNANVHKQEHSKFSAEHSTAGNKAVLQRQAQKKFRLRQKVHRCLPSSPKLAVLCADSPVTRTQCMYRKGPRRLRHNWSTQQQN